VEHIQSYRLERRYDPVFLCFSATPTTEIYALSLHDALPIYYDRTERACRFEPIISDGASALVHRGAVSVPAMPVKLRTRRATLRSEEHTSELQSRGHLVCRLLLEKKQPQPRVAQHPLLRRAA